MRTLAAGFLAAAASGFAAAFAPQWTAPMPDASKPLAGFKQVPGAVHTELYHATPEWGGYNHAAMMGFYDGSLIVTFKNGVQSEDRPGQRVLYSVTQDGVNWSPTSTDNAILFPNVSTNSNPAHLFAEPPIVLNGRVYGAASPIQFCLYPDQYEPKLLLRRMDFSKCHANGTDAASAPCLPALGPMFWAWDSIPSGFEEASKLLDIRTIPQMDQETQADMRTLQDPLVLPCASSFPPSRSGAGAGETTKCEASVGGLQNWTLPLSLDLANERTHYISPLEADVDVLLYRSRKNMLYFAYRNESSASRSPRVAVQGRVRGGAKTLPLPASSAAGNTWSVPAATNIPDVDSNINSGRLFDGRIYLVSNSNSKGDMRDPLTIATSADGQAFDRVAVVVSCTELGPDDSKCKERLPGSAKSPGAQYPQAIDIRGWSEGGGSGQDGTYVVYSLNKEDIWITYLPPGSIPN